MALVVLALYLAPQTVKADPIPLPSSMMLSCTSIFETTVWFHFRESKKCWGGQAKRQPYTTVVRKEIRGMLAACERFWPGDQSAPYRMLALMLSETNGHPEGAAPPEKSFGPWCTTIDEVRETSRLFGISCPRSDSQIQKKLIEDQEWAAIITAGTLWRYDRVQGGDVIRGTLTYKMGVRGLSKAERGLAMAKKPITATPTWMHYSALLSWVNCLRDRVQLGDTGIPGSSPCGCMTPELQSNGW